MNNGQTSKLLQSNFQTNPPLHINQIDENKIQLWEVNPIYNNIFI